MQSEVWRGWHELHRTNVYFHLTCTGCHTHLHMVWYILDNQTVTSSRWCRHTWYKIWPKLQLLLRYPFRLIFLIDYWLVSLACNMTWQFNMTWFTVTRFHMSCSPHYGLFVVKWCRCVIGCTDCYEMVVMTTWDACKWCNVKMNMQCDGWTVCAWFQRQVPLLVQTAEYRKCDH